MYRKLRYVGRSLSGPERPVNQGAPNGTTELFPEVSSRDFTKDQVTHLQISIDIVPYLFIISLEQAGPSRPADLAIMFQF